MATMSQATAAGQQQPPPIQHYRQLLLDCQNLQAKISELETDQKEHLLVEETLKPLDPTRRAYRLVGDCLVERTVQDVLPSVTANRENMEKTIAVLREKLETSQTEVAEIKAKYNIQD